MPNHLMIIAWPTGVGNQIATSFRYAPYVLQIAPSYAMTDNRPDHTKLLSLMEDPLN